MPENKLVGKPVKSYTVAFRRRRMRYLDVRLTGDNGKITVSLSSIHTQLRLHADNAIVFENQRLLRIVSAVQLMLEQVTCQRQHDATPPHIGVIEAKLSPGAIRL